MQLNILFEGLDLAGKSTICRLIQQRLGEHWFIRRNSIVLDNPVYNLANKLRLQGTYDDLSLGYLYHAALKFDLSIYAEESAASRPYIIQDSTIIMRSIAFHQASGNLDLAKLFFDSICDFPIFDHVFVCRVSHEERLSRLALRRKENLSSEDYLVATQPGLFYKMESILIDILHSRYHAIDLNTGGDLKNDIDRIHEIQDEIIGHMEGNVPK